MLHVVLREFARSSWIPGCRKLIQERCNIRGEFTHRGNGGIGGRKPRRFWRFLVSTRRSNSQDWLVQVGEEELELETAGTKL